MIIKFSRKFKIIALSLLAVISCVFGLFLECCDKKEFEISSIPAQSELPKVKKTYNSHYDENGRLDINLATVEELETLDGIGEKKAQNIVDYRNEHDGFMEVEELDLVTGIGKSIIENIYDKICVR